ncbi:hypothetical protein BJX99DRAFT_259014 [Aspergillus californicus]
MTLLSPATKDESFIRELAILRRPLDSDSSRSIAPLTEIIWKIIPDRVQETPSPIRYEMFSDIIVRIQALLENSNVLWNISTHTNMHPELLHSPVSRSSTTVDISNCRHGSLNFSPVRFFSTGRPASFETAKTAMDSLKTSHTAYIALGSNVGERVEMIEQACLELDRAGIKVRRTSSLFETAPMYYLDQDPFMNGVCEVETKLGPLELLDALQSIEIALGRKKLIDKGPRSIDLDILLYDQETFSNDRLIIPHKLMLERDFVLRPLSQ